ncbi:hydroxylase [Alteromonas sp. ASW11-19]|uniref:Hydroxylase n=1 Tax=Alteromonas salexigens TaxID=2982530 RepID=A0ABT2VQH2_9ALTE|nr:hydroxylase [Alteromonas salexigens]MCU7555324.1 hydroxylase [Alteromonas salexigens]
MELHYLEIVSTDVEKACRNYEQLHGVTLSKPDEVLGGARTCEVAGGYMLGIRAPLHTDEQPVVRPYWRVTDIEQAVADLQSHGATLALPPTELPGKGHIAIYLLGGNEHGVWQPA